MHVEVAHGEVLAREVVLLVHAGAHDILVINRALGFDPVVVVASAIGIGNRQHV